MEFNKQNIQSKVTAAQSHVVDEGLRAYMLKVYNYMTSGIFLTGIVSLFLFKFSGGYNIQLTSAGITGTNAFGDCTKNQNECYKFSTGINKKDLHEVDDEIMHKIVFYLSSLSPPKRRNVSDKNVL